MWPLSSSTAKTLRHPVLCFHPRQVIVKKKKKSIYRAVFGDQRLSELSHSHVLLYFFILPSSLLSSVRAVGSNVQVRCRRCAPLTPPLSPMRNTRLLRSCREREGGNSGWKWLSGARPSNGFRRAIALT